MKVSKIDENGQTMKKSRKSGLKILANNNDQDNNYKMYRTQMIWYIFYYKYILNNSKCRNIY